MKIVINETGKIEKVSEKMASRLINKGKAHKAKNIPVIVPLNTVQKKELLEDLVKSKKEFADISDKVFEVPKPKRRYRKKKSKFKEWND